MVIESIFGEEDCSVVEPLVAGCTTAMRLNVRATVAKQARAIEGTSGTCTVVFVQAVHFRHAFLPSHPPPLSLHAGCVPPAAGTSLPLVHRVGARAITVTLPLLYRYFRTVTLPLRGSRSGSLC